MKFKLVHRKVKRRGDREWEVFFPNGLERRTYSSFVEACQIVNQQSFKCELWFHGKIVARSMPTATNAA